MTRDSWLCLACVLAASACGAVYPEIATPLRPVPASAKIDPGPPRDVIYIEAGSARIPDHTPDGRKWTGTPDPYVILFAGKTEILRTPVQSNTLAPTWPDAVKGNYRIAPGTPVRYELWDSTGFTHRPICLSTIDDIHQEAEYGQVDIDCGNDAYATLVVKRAQPSFGLGLLYELRAQDVYVTRVFSESPASRMGIGPGMQITAIMGQPTHGMDPDLVRSLITTHARTGMDLTVQKAEGETLTVSLKEGPVYPLLGENTDVIR